MTSTGTTVNEALSTTVPIKARTWRWTRNLTAKIAAIPMIFTAFIVFIGGALWTVFYSFTSSKLLPVTKFVGFDQYERLFSTLRWYQAMTNIVIFGVLAMSIGLILGFLLACLLDQKIRFEDMFRSIYLHPYAMSLIVTGLVWAWILSPYAGIEKVMHDLGFAWFQFDWITRPDLAIYTIVIGAIWQGTGLNMALMLAGLRGVDQEIWKAARVDGIPTWRAYLFIALPTMRPVLVTAIVLNVTGIVRVYDIVVAMTNGGPGTSTDVPARYVIDLMFHNGNLGQGLAAATIMLSAVLVVLVPWSVNEYKVRQREEA